MYSAVSFTLVREPRLILFICLFIIFWFTSSFILLLILLLILTYFLSVFLFFSGSPLPLFFFLPFSFREKQKQKTNHHYHREQKTLKQSILQSQLVTECKRQGGRVGAGWVGGSQIYKNKNRKKRMMHVALFKLVPKPASCRL